MTEHGATPGTRVPLSTPLTSRRPRFSFDSDAVGRYSEAVARFFGTGTYLLIQTIVVIVWIVLNVAVVALRFDPYPFILLNLAFSTQAAYAAPLILLAQNRQEDRDKDRKSTRLNSSHVSISYAVFCLKKNRRKLDSNDLR